MREDSAQTMAGLITNVQRFSIHDGPGIRTTVFLKGCPLSCFWCHNPEDRRAQPEVQWFPDRCIGCRACLDECPQDAQGLEGDMRVFRRERCDVCGSCVKVCYADALVLSGRWWEPDELLGLLLRDREFYDQSGGGVTLSGGEPVVQHAFSRTRSGAVSRRRSAYRHRDRGPLLLGALGRSAALARPGAAGR